MEDPGSSITLLLMFVLLFFSGLFSGSETAFFGIANYRLRELRDEGSVRAKKISSMLENPDKLLTTLLIGNTAVNIAFTSLVTVFVIALTSDALSKDLSSIIATLITTGLLLIFGEITPKALAANDSEGFAFRVVGLINPISVILKPVVCIINTIANMFIGKTIKDNDAREEAFTEEIIKTAVSIGEEYGTVEEDEKNLIYNIFKSTDLLVKDIMIPKDEIIMIDEEATVKEAAMLLSEEGYTRLPVLSRKSDIDFICGIIYAKDLLEHLRDKEFDIPVAQVMRAPSYCRPNDKGVFMLMQMRQKGRHMAIVRDAKGTILGLVTLEDLLEVIVGDIIDEYDFDELTDLNVKGGA